MHKPSLNKIIVATCFGAFLEWYDFLTFATLVFIFGPLFFPPSNPNLALLSSLAIFGAGMIVRPLGSLFFGALGDQIGRKPIFIITIALMGFATLSVGFLPTYSQIGVWAPILLTTLRLLQGFSAGGEIGGSSIYLTEHAGNNHRGLKTSFLQLMGPLGILASTLQIAFLQKWISPEQFQSWGWRIPFWVSIVLLFISLLIRKSLEETPVFLDLSKQGLTNKLQLFNNFKDPEIRKRMLLLFFCISSSGAALFFCVLVYTSIFLKSSTKLNHNTVDMLTIYAIVILFPFTIFAGWLSDKYGRKPITLSGLILGSIFIFPAFEMLHRLSNLYITSHDYSLLWLIGLILSTLSFSLGLVIGPQTALLTELFPAKSRNSAATLSHNLAAGWIGGSLPFVVTFLNQQFNSNLIGLLYPTIFLALAALVCYLYFPETKDTDLN